MTAWPAWEEYGSSARHDHPIVAIAIHYMTLLHFFTASYCAVFVNLFPIFE